MGSFEILFQQFLAIPAQEYFEKGIVKYTLHVPRVLNVDIGQDIPRISHQIEHDAVKKQADGNAILEQRLIRLVTEHEHGHPGAESPADNRKKEKDELGDTPFSISRTMLVVAIQKERKHVNDKLADEENK